MSKIDYVFLDGGHDYDLSQAPGVKQAIDEFISKNDCKFSIIEKRFVKLEF